MKTIYTLSLILLLVECKTETTSWTDLFNGSDINNWEVKGGKAAYKVIDGSIEGTYSMAAEENIFLCTKEKYSDFILEYEFMLTQEVNSGVQIRSNSKTEYKDGRVHGYQVEIDPTERAYTGGIYDEARAGWLYPLSYNPDAAKKIATNTWYKVRVEAIGNSIKTWINGNPASNLVDNSDTSGFIALQVHKIKDSIYDGAKVYWKNIRILEEDLDNNKTETNAPVVSYQVNQLTEDEVKEGWKLLFDGETNKNWRRAYHDSFPEKGWIIENGVLTVLSSDGAESQNGGDIVTVDEYSDFDLRLQFKITPGANSGIKYFVTEQEEGNKKSAIGLEYQILDDELHPDAKLGNHEGSRTLASLYDLIKAENKRFAGIGKWNNARIISKGNHVEHWLNNVKVLEYDRFTHEFEKLVSESKYVKWPHFGKANKGHILLQDHGNEVSFRSIKIKEL